MPFVVITKTCLYLQILYKLKLLTNQYFVNVIPCKSYFCIYFCILQIITCTLFLNILKRVHKTQLIHDYTCITSNIHFLRQEDLGKTVDVPTSYHISEYAVPSDALHTGTINCQIGPGFTSFKDVKDI